MARASSALLSASVLLLLCPTGSALPADAYNIPGLAGTPPAFVAPVGPPAWFLPPATAVGVLGDQIVGNFNGAGSCNVAGEACFAWPTWNPNVAAPVMGWTCEITGVARTFLLAPNWVLPKVFLGQDSNQDGILFNVGDVVYRIDATNPVGAIAFLPGPPGVGGYTGDLFGPPGSGLFTPGRTVHVVSDDLGQGPNPFLDLAVTCWVL